MVVKEVCYAIKGDSLQIRRKGQRVSGQSPFGRHFLTVRNTNACHTVGSYMYYILQLF